MELSNILLVMASLLSGATPTKKSQAYFSGTGDLPCHFTNSENISLGELVLFWQNQDNMVLYELFRGRENPQNVHFTYKGRTSLDRDNWTLRLHNIQIKDKGLYQCFVHHKGPKGLIPIYQMSIDLSVLANFSQPEIMPISNRTENSDSVNLTCSSTQGYPEPKKMSFVLKTKNSTTEYGVVMNIFQNNITELYSVSISFSFPVFPETNVSIFCVLQPQSTQTQLLSQPFNIDPKIPKPPQPDPGHGLLITVLPPLLVIICGTVLCTKKRKKKQPVPSHECETIKLESEENEQSKGRVENRVPERSDEAQCVSNTSKTASDMVAVMRSKETSGSFRDKKHQHGTHEPFGVHNHSRHF